MLADNWLAESMAKYDHDLTVFLTIGFAKISGANADAALRDALGLRFRKLKIPNAIGDARYIGA